jgi:DNA-directed RNA polymerase subunit RPC12/RpoP
MADGKFVSTDVTTTTAAAAMCEKCGEKILNVMTADEQKVYHPQCFVCSDCGKTLAGGFFYKSKTTKTNETRTSLVESVRFCETCYKKVAPKWFVHEST